jgi:plastocyanin
MSWVSKTLFIIFLSSCLSCSRSKVLNREEYPDFSEKAKLPATEAITMCTSKVFGPNYHVVEIKQMKFMPADLLVKKGDTVCWINKDITTHDITEEVKKKWSSAPLATGQSWTKIISENASYYCSIHVVMKGKLKIE